jgi:tetratricopeptide (TPR) repeat protein
MQTRLRAIGFLALLIVSLAADRLPAADDDWIGQRVMLKETAKPKVGTKSFKWNDVPLPATVDKIDGDWLWVGIAWVKEDDAIKLDDAADYYTQLIARSSALDDKAVGYLLRSVTWISKREYDNAIKDLNVLIGLAPENPTFRLIRGKAYHGKRQWDEAMTDFTEAIRLDPTNLIAYNDRGVTWTGKSEYHKAEQQFNEVLRRAPNNALAYANRGTNWFKQDEYDKALGDLTHAIKLDPKMSFAYANRGRVYMKLGNYPEAMADYEKAIKIAPHEWPAYNGRARIWATAPDFVYHLRDGKKALAEAKKACELANWDEWYCLATLAAAYAETGDFESAVKWQTKAMEMSQPAEDRDQEDNEKRLALYKAGKPYHEEVAVKKSDDEPAPDERVPEDSK